MTETWCPFANIERGPYDAGSHGGPITTPVLGVICHITTNHFDPGPFFANPNNQASSHFWIADDGTLVEYLPVEVASWAQAAGNYLYWSVETSGVDGTPMTDPQVLTFARLYRWLQSQPSASFGFDLADTPGARGLGWHGMGGAAYGGHYDCPGDARKNQRPQILAVAQGAPPPTPEDDMPLSDTDLQKIADDCVRPLLTNFWNGQFGPKLDELDNRLKAIEAKLGVPNT